MNVTRSIVFPLIAVALAIASAPGAVAQNAARAALLDYEIVAPRLLRQDGQTTLTIEGYGRAWRLELRPNGGLLESLSPQARAQVEKPQSFLYRSGRRGARLVGAGQSHRRTIDRDVFRRADAVYG